MPSISATTSSPGASGGPRANLAVDDQPRLSRRPGRAGSEHERQMQHVAGDDVLHRARLAGEVDELQRDAQLVVADRDDDLAVGMQRAGAARVERCARWQLGRGGEVAGHRRVADQLRHAGDAEAGLPSNAATVAGAQLRPDSRDDAWVDGDQGRQRDRRRTASARNTRFGLARIFINGDASAAGPPHERRCARLARGRSAIGSPARPCDARGEG
jgi:hypothetical protein